MPDAAIPARSGALDGRAPLAMPCIAIWPLEPAARFSLRLPESDISSIGAVAGFQINRSILTSSVSGERLSARLGPNEWLLIGPEAAACAIQAEVEAGLEGRFFSLVDIGHRHVANAVSGGLAPVVLNAGCPLDLDDTTFPVGGATRTLLGKAEIVLLRTDAVTYRIECWRSFGPYIHDFLREAARDVEHP